MHKAEEKEAQKKAKKKNEDQVDLQVEEDAKLLCDKMKEAYHKDIKANESAKPAL